MSPSQIVKSAYRDAVKAGCKVSLKQWARNAAKVDPHCTAALWLSIKAEQRKQANACARKTRRGHDVVHTQQHARSMEHCTGRGNIVFHGGGRP